MGVTPSSGGTTPRYNPVGPSLANIFFTTSKPPVYVPGAAVCSRVLVKSNGWPSGRKPRGNVHDQTKIATMQYIELTNLPTLRRRPQIPQRQKLSHSPLRPTRPRLASLSCLWSPARTSLRSKARPNSHIRDEIWREGQSDPPYSLLNEKMKCRGLPD
jgi:hypothetical protein